MIHAHAPNTSIASMPKSNHPAKIASSGLKPSPETKIGQNLEQSTVAGIDTAACDHSIQERIVTLLQQTPTPLAALNQVIACLGELLSANCGTLWLKSKNSTDLQRELLWHSSGINLSASELEAMDHCPMRDNAPPDQHTLLAHQTGVLAWAVSRADKQTLVTKAGKPGNLIIPLLAKNPIQDCSQLHICALPLMHGDLSMGVITLLTPHNRAEDDALGRALSHLGRQIGRQLQTEAHA